MCAGAVREAVFSVPVVIRRINADFVPVTLNMLSPLMESDDDEGRLFQSICRSRVQPQGTCVLNTGGQVLTWVLTYDKDQSVLDFLDHSLKRFRKHPDAKRPIVTERYMQFPSGRVEDVREEAKPAALAKVHATGTRCLAKGRQPRGTFVAKVIGRALDENGKLSSHTINQEHLALDHFFVTPEMQAELAKVLANAGTRRVRIPDDLARLCVAYAFLGNKDAGPLTQMSVFAVSGKLKECEFWAQKVASGGRQPADGDGKTPALWRVEGKSDVVGEGNQGDFGVWHEVKLTWEGFIGMNGTRMTRLLLSARGSEKLKWGSEGLKAQAKAQDEVAFLPAGRPIEMACGVLYGIIGEPLPADEVDDRNAASQTPASPPGSALPQKMQKLQAAVRKWQQDGKDLTPVRKIMQHFGPLMKQGKPKDSEAVLDKALKLLDEKK